MAPTSSTLRVLDASVLINLLAIETDIARAILTACGGGFVVTTQVAAEVLRDPRDPNIRASQRIAELSSNLIESVSLPPPTLDRFVDLSCSMGDGEASVLAYAEVAGGIAVVDDRDARHSLLEIPREWSVDVLLHPNVRRSVDADLLAAAVFDAATLARMRVPARRQPEVAALIGEDRARLCPGLSRLFRGQPGPVHN